jgi:hypothetical protein
MHRLFVTIGVTCLVTQAALAEPHDNYLLHPLQILLRSATQQVERLALALSPIVAQPIRGTSTAILRLRNARGEQGVALGPMGSMGPMGKLFQMQAQRCLALVDPQAASQRAVMVVQLLVGRLRALAAPRISAERRPARTWEAASCPDQRRPEPTAEQAA